MVMRLHPLDKVKTKYYENYPNFALIITFQKLIFWTQNWFLFSILFFGERILSIGSIIKI